MPRIAIKDYDTSFFHVMVQGIRKECIFDTNEDKEENLDKNKIDKFKIKLDSEKIKEISKKLNEKCELTHKEIADEFGGNKIKITILINSD